MIWFPDKFQFKKTTKIDSESPQIIDIRNAAEDVDGSLWIASESGLFKYIPENGLE